MDIINRLQQLTKDPNETHKLQWDLQRVLSESSLSSLENEVYNTVKNLSEKKEQDLEFRVVFRGVDEKFQIFHVNIKDLIFGHLEIVEISHNKSYHLFSIDKRVRGSKYTGWIDISDRVFQGDIIEYWTHRAPDGYTCQSKYDGYYPFRGIVLDYNHYDGIKVNENNFYNNSILHPRGREQDSRKIGLNWIREIKILGNIYYDKNLLNERCTYEKPR